MTRITRSYLRETILPFKFTDENPGEFFFKGKKPFIYIPIPQILQKRSKYKVVRVTLTAIGARELQNIFIIFLITLSFVRSLFQHGGQLGFRRLHVKSK